LNLPNFALQIQELSTFEKKYLIEEYSMETFPPNMILNNNQETRLPHLKFEIPRNQSKLVIVDGSQQLVRVYEKYLVAAGLKVVAKFFSGEDLLSYLNSDKNRLTDSIILIEHKLPLMDGIEVTKQVKQVHPDQKIILLTLEEDLFKFKLDANLFDGMLQKPITMTELLRTLEKVASPLRMKGSWIFDNPDDIRRLLRDILDDTNEKMCAVRLPTSVIRGLNVASHIPTYNAATAKGLKVYMITEITKDNMFYCKQVLLNSGVQLRHLDGVQHNFAVWDAKHLVEGIQTPSDSFSMGACLYSNLSQIVDKNQYLFDHLWGISIPGDQKIKELESNTIPSRVSIISGEDEIFQTMQGMIQGAHAYLDACIVPPYSINLSSPELLQAMVGMISRGIHSKILFEVTKNSSSLVKRMMEMGIEVRHLSNLKGSFGLNEKELMTTATFNDKESSQQAAMLYSNHSGLVEQHKAIFEKLWNGATPASLKIEEIERQDQEISPKKI
jgi:CheY-like chemotaxis protein